MGERPPPPGGGLARGTTPHPEWSCTGESTPLQGEYFHRVSTGFPHVQNYPPKRAKSLQTKDVAGWRKTREKRGWRATFFLQISCHCKPLQTKDVAGGRGCPPPPDTAKVAGCRPYGARHPATFAWLGAAPLAGQRPCATVLIDAERYALRLNRADRWRYRNRRRGVGMVPSSRRGSLRGGKPQVLSNF